MFSMTHKHLSLDCTTKVLLNFWHGLSSLILIWHLCTNWAETVREFCPPHGMLSYLCHDIANHLLWFVMERPCQCVSWWTPLKLLTNSREPLLIDLFGLAGNVLGQQCVSAPAQGAVTLRPKRGADRSILCRQTSFATDAHPVGYKGQ